MSKNHRAHRERGEKKQSLNPLTANTCSCLLPMSNEHQQSLWVIHWVKYTQRTGNMACLISQINFYCVVYPLFLSGPKKTQKTIQISSGLSFSPFFAIFLHITASTLLFFTYHSTCWCLFNTIDDPDARNSSFHLPPASLGQGLMERGQGGESQSSSMWEILSAGCLEPLLSQHCPTKWQPVPIRCSVLVTLQATWSTSDVKRQTDWSHSLSLDHYTALSNPVSPLHLFLAHPFPHPPSCPRGLWPPLQFFVNNTGALWKDEWWQRRRKVGWRNREIV